MIAGEIDAGFGDQRCQPCDEIHRFESHLGCSIAVGRLQSVEYMIHKVTSNTHQVNPTLICCDLVNRLHHFFIFSSLSKPLRQSRGGA